MAEIKRIQLRGISRAPSDRMTEDGGVAESLNVFLDNGEVAPSVQPRDVTEKWHYPTTLKVEYSYIHKTANYERLIVVANGNVGYLDENGVNVITTLSAGESVSDITSLGNTLVISTTNKVLYVLYKDGKYEELGNKVPFPQIQFTCQLEDLDSPTIERGDGKYWFKTVPSEEEWNADGANGAAHKNTTIKALLQAISTECQNIEVPVGNIYKDRRFIRYCATLYDGSKISSMPILLNTPEKYSIEFYARLITYTEGGLEDEVTNEVTIESNGAYKIRAVLANEEEFVKWADLVKSIDFYVSRGTAPSISYTSSRISDRYEETTYVESGTTYNHYETKSGCRISFNTISGDTQALLEDSALTYKIHTIPLRSVEDDKDSPLSQEFLALKDGIIIPNEYRDSTLEQQELLSQDDMKHYPVTAMQHFTYNNQLILMQPTNIITYGYNWLNDQQKLKAPTPNLDAPRRTKSTLFEITYLLRTADGSNIASKVTSVVSDVESWYAITRTYSFQVFPDSRCYRMVVKATQQVRSEGGMLLLSKVSYADLEMKPHPYLDCAYHYVKADKRLIDLCTLETQPIIDAKKNTYDDVDNAIYVSEMNNPFVFPIDQQFVFPGKVIGGAVATFALSQGQFGQFPLYLFTSEGVYSMEAGEDGRFVATKPVTRDVCINPSSITAIDQAVVFVTEAGVLLLRGSEATNISPFMLRKPQRLSSQQETLVGTTEFAPLLTSAKDEQFFMDFMRIASVMYDYAGERLIFSRPDFAFQYVYKLDTNTWHKLQLGVSDIRPLNSYPEALAIVTGDQASYIYYQEAPYPNTDDFTLFSNLLNNFNKNFNHLAYGFMRMTIQEVRAFLNGTHVIDVTHLGYTSKMQNVLNFFASYGLKCARKVFNASRVYDFSQVYNDTNDASVAKGIIVTRPFDLDHPDILKSITDVRVRGQFPKGAVKFILEGSNDGVNFYVLNSLRGRSWKLFRLTLLCDLAPEDRVSWVDVMYETRFTNKLR